MNHSRSRELYDMTMLEVRRVLYPDLPPRRLIVPGQLLGTRYKWMVRYADLMNPYDSLIVDEPSDLGLIDIRLVHDREASFDRGRDGLARQMGIGRNHAKVADLSRDAGQWAYQLIQS